VHDEGPEGAAADGRPDPAPDLTSRKRRRTALIAGAAAATVLSLVAGGVLVLTGVAADDSDRPRAGATGTTAAPVAPGAPSGPAPVDRNGLTASERLARDRAVEAILRRRSSAVLRQDRAAFLADVDRREPAVYKRQARLFANYSKIGLSAFSYEVVGAYQTDVRDRYDAPTYLPATVLRYRIKGFDSGPVAQALVYTFVLRDGVWKIGGDSDVDKELPAGGNAAAWDVEAVAVTTTRHTKVIGTRGDERLHEELARQVDRAVDEVSEVWSGDWSGKVVVIASRDPEVLSSFFRDPERSVKRTAAVAMPVTRDVFGWVYRPGSSGEATGDRVIVNSAQLGRVGSLDFQLLMVHEVTHVATRAISAPGTPTWLVEGAAEWTALRGYVPDIDAMAPSVQKAIDGPGLTSTPASRGFYGAAADANYNVSWLVCRHIAERYGPRKLVRLYTRLGARSAGKAAPSEDAAIKETLGVTKAQLLRGASLSARAYR
jgi:hypothetical protein